MVDRKNTYPRLGSTLSFLVSLLREQTVQPCQEPWRSVELELHLYVFGSYLLGMHARPGVDGGDADTVKNIKTITAV